MQKIEIVVSGPYDNTTLFADLDDPPSIKELERDVRRILEKNHRYALKNAKKEDKA